MGKRREHRWLGIVMLLTAGAVSALLAGSMREETTLDARAEVLADESHWAEVPTICLDLSAKSQVQLSEGSALLRTAEFKRLHARMKHEGEYRTYVPRASLSASLDRPASHLRRSTIKPILKNGTLTGYLIAPVESSSGLALVGMREGDVILAFNGQTAEGPEGLSTLYRGIRNKNDHHFLIQRKGSVHCLHVTFE